MSRKLTRGLVPIIVLVVVLMAAASVGAVVYRSGKTPEMREPPSPSKSQVNLFFIALEDKGQTGKKIGCDDTVVAVPVTILANAMPLRTTLNQLLAVKDQFYGSTGLYNALASSNLTVSSVRLEGAKALVDLSGTVSLGGVCDDPRFQAQIEETILQFEEVKSVEVFINGSPIESVTSGRGY